MWQRGKTRSLYGAFTQPPQRPLGENEQFWKTLGQTRMDLASLLLWAFIKIEHFPILDFPINIFQRKLSLMRPLSHDVQKCRTLVLKFRTCVICPFNPLLHATQAGATLKQWFPIYSPCIPSLFLLIFAQPAPTSQDMQFFPKIRSSSKGTFFLKFFPSRSNNKPPLHCACTSLLNQTDFLYIINLHFLSLCSIKTGKAMSYLFSYHSNRLQLNI